MKILNFLYRSRILTLLLLVGAAFTAKGQTPDINASVEVPEKAAQKSSYYRGVFNNPDNHTYFGVRASVNFSIPDRIVNTTLNYSTGTGVAAGGIFHLPIVANFYFEPGLTLSYANYGIEKHSIPETPSLMYYGSYRRLGLEVPLTLGYHFDFIHTATKLYIYIAPVPYVGLLGRRYITAEKTAFKETNHYSIFGDGKANRFDLGYKLGFAVSARQFFVAVEMFELFDRAVCDLPGEKYDLNNVRLTLGYNF